MINKQDIRIGNYISFEGESAEVIGITALTVKHRRLSDQSIYTTAFNEIEGIRITPEFLNQTGWEAIFRFSDQWIKQYKHQEYYFSLGDYPKENPNCGYLMAHYPRHEDVSYDEQGNEIPVVFEESTVTIAHGIHDVHELQNLWHGITKEELIYE